MAQTILQHPILTNFVYPFLIVFFIVFAVLEKTNILGDDKKQLNAFLSFVIGLVFVSAVFPKQAVENMVLFLSVAIVILFVFFILWYFINSGGEGDINLTKGMKVVLSIVFVLAFIVAVLWATGVGGDVYNFFVNKIWGSAFVTNVVFIVLIAVALGVVVGKSKGGDD